MPYLRCAHCGGQLLLDVDEDGRVPLVLAYELRCAHCARTVAIRTLPPQTRAIIENMLPANVREALRRLREPMDMKDSDMTPKRGRPAGSKNKPIPLRVRQPNVTRTLTLI